MEGQLRVTPQELINTSEEFNSRGAAISSLTQQMLEKVASLSGGWEGDASGAYTRKLSELSGDIEQIRNKINEHVTDLQQMAANYIQAEDAATEAHNAMSSDLID